MGIRGGLLAESKAKESYVHAVVRRADGTVEDLGRVAYWHRNPVMRFAWRVKQFLKRR